MGRFSSFIMRSITKDIISKSLCCTVNKNLILYAHDKNENVTGKTYFGMQDPRGWKRHFRNNLMWNTKFINRSQQLHK